MISTFSSHRSVLYVDACCWINLFATGRISEILQVTPRRFRTSDFVADQEVLTVKGQKPGERESLSLRNLESLGLVEICTLSTAAETRELVRFAAYLDDGEASVCALAVAKGDAVATDDRKALRILTGYAPAIPQVQTPQLLHEWAEIAKPPPDVLRDVLGRVELRARFVPRMDVPFATWWARKR